MKTYPDFKKIWEECVALSKEYRDKCDKVKNILPEQYSVFTPHKEEFAINSRYLHRGFYCPSPSLEHLVINMHRGTIAKRLTSRSRITNHYLFDEENRIRIAETFYPNGFVQTEYIFYDNNNIIGFTLDTTNCGLREISVEWYKNDKITSYLFCVLGSNQSSIHSMLYEKYYYNNKNKLHIEHYDMLGNRYDVVQYTPYSVSLDENGKVLNLISNDM